MGRKREKEMKERMYEVNMNDTRKQYERKRQGQGVKRESGDKNTIFFLYVKL
jgi:hypothetical protein